MSDARLIPDTIRHDGVSKDEFEIALEEGIEDEALLENPGVKKFTISSYGADYTVDTLVIECERVSSKYHRSSEHSSGHSSTHRNSSSLCLWVCQFRAFFFIKKRTPMSIW